MRREGGGVGGGGRRTEEGGGGGGRERRRGRRRRTFCLSATFHISERKVNKDFCLLGRLCVRLRASISVLCNEWCYSLRAAALTDAALDE